jgi:hypothetical protein
MLLASAILAWFCQACVGGGTLITRPGDGGPAVDATINGPWRITFSAEDSLFVYERNDDGPPDAIRRIQAYNEIVSTIQVQGCDFPTQPNPKPRPVGCFGPLSQLRSNGLTGLLLSEYLWGRLRRVDLRTSALSTIAGNGLDLSRGDDGPAIEASFHRPLCFAVDSSGNIFVCDAGRIRRIDSRTSIITTVAGSGIRGSKGDGGPATAAQISPIALAVGADGDLYISDDVPVPNQGSLGPGIYRIRRIDSRTREIQTIAGSGDGLSDESHLKGDGRSALQTDLSRPEALTLDGSGNLFFINGEFKISRIDLRSGRLYHVAGSGSPGATGDGDLAIRATIDAVDLALDSKGNLFIADWQNSKIRRIDSRTGIITTFAGNGLPHRKPPAYQ